MKTEYSIVAIALVCSLALVYGLAQRDTVAEAAATTGSPQLAAAAAESDTASLGETSGEVVAKVADTAEADFIAELRERFGPHIDIAHARIRVIEQVLSYLRSRYPDDWETRVADFLAALFPEHADTLLDRYNSLAQYNDWLKGNRDGLQSMSRDDRRAALWQARELAFGPEAEQIWAAERRTERLHTALGELDTSAPPVTQAAAFVATIAEVYGEGAEGFLRKRQTELSNRFLAREAIQTQLKDMDADTRRQTLRAVRAEFGMPADALDRWERLDEHRDAVWSRGQAYMQARTELADSGDSWQLDELRRRHFGPEAEQIRIEEQGGFFRFAGARRIGRE